MIKISLAGQVAVVTGAARGMGRAIALKLAEAGCKGVTINDLKVDTDAHEVAREAQTFGAEVLLIEGDVSKEEDVKRIISETVNKWGRLDILVNNAGIAKRGDIFSTSGDQWERVIDVNLKSVFLGMKYGAEYMKKQGEGRIVNMASISGITGGTQGPDYSASKAGIIALTKFGAKTLSKFGIRVNALAPGYIDTVLLDGLWAAAGPEVKRQRLATIPMGRMGTPEEVANVALFLVSDLASYITGETIMVTGGRMS